MVEEASLDGGAIAICTSIQLLAAWSDFIVVVAEGALLVALHKALDLLFVFLLDRCLVVDDAASLRLRLSVKLD